MHTNAVLDHSNILERLKYLEILFHTKASLPIIQNKISQLENLIKRKVDASTYNTKISQICHNINSKTNTRDVDTKLKNKADYTDICVLDRKANNFTYSVGIKADNIPTQH